MIQRHPIERRISHIDVAGFSEPRLVRRQHHGLALGRAQVNALQRLRGILLRTPCHQQQRRRDAKQPCHAALARQHFTKSAETHPNFDEDSLKDVVFSSSDACHAIQQQTSCLLRASVTMCASCSLAPKDNWHATWHSLCPATSSCCAPIESSRSVTTSRSSRA